MYLEEGQYTELVKLRRELHRFPEVSNHEEETAIRIVEFLSALNPSRILTDLGKTSVAAVFNAKEKAENTAVVRCELDALPIQEVNDFSYQSTVDGVSHKCGHDGHMAIVAGLGMLLSKEPLERLNVVLLFQQAEETGEGARAVLNDEKFTDLQPDFVLALHNIPGYPKNQIVLKPQAFTPAVTSVIITLHGKTSHAAEPEKGINPALAVSKIVVLANELEVNEESDDMQLLTPIQIELGEEAFGISAGHAEIKFTLRAWSDERLESLKNEFSNRIFEIAAADRLGIMLEWTQSFSSNFNSLELVDELEKASTQLGLDVLHKAYPFKWGEDFGLFTQYYQGALFGLGAGEETPALHNPDYDFPDELIHTGVAMFYQTLKQLNDK